MYNSDIILCYPTKCVVIKHKFSFFNISKLKIFFNFLPFCFTHILEYKNILKTIWTLEISEIFLIFKSSLSLKCSYFGYKKIWEGPWTAKEMDRTLISQGGPLTKIEV